ncbi:zinc-coordinating transcription factor SFP1 LALA0_S03e06964g [Lachancea lanzarotensis]|uniref:LALA0S03e06964g1_1 n=1 Tax=Lachancea lanzarotensis TaxID=1245769 RepID=A0A0C7MVN5_9SACH|nr:uncharacterized protein LALA0_S03e06964g [Lachancea lanzarotensis]CEP61618.1 LALA0S03e06964g1_1 [Lachancea lanzarotensis]
MDVSSATASNAAGSTPGILINNEMSASSSSQQVANSVNPANMAKLRRESIAHSQGMGGVSWGSLTIGSWLRDEVMIHAHMSQAAHQGSSGVPQHTYIGNTAGSSAAGNLAGGSSFSPPGAASAYLPNLEKQYCKDYSCCGLLLPGLHDLLRHYEEAHISTSPGTINTHASSVANIPTNAGLSSGAMTGMAGVNSAQVANNNALKKRRMTAMYQQQLQQQQRQTPQQQQFHQRQSMQEAQAPHGHQQQHLNQSSQHQRQQQAGNQQGLPHQQQHHNIQYQQFAKQQQPQQNAQQQQPQQQQQQHNSHVQQQMQNQMFNQAMQQQLHGGPHNPSSNTTSNIQQLHLNGNLVDAVSTNEVFLQNGAGQSGKRGPMANAGVSGSGFNGSAGSNNNNKMQGGFNNYSLNMQPHGKQGLDASVMQQFQSQQHQQQSQVSNQHHSQHTGLQQHHLQQRQSALLQQQQQQQQQQMLHQQQQQQQRVMGNASNAALLNRQRFPSQVGSVGAGIDLDFMDADIVDDLHDGSAIMGGAAPPLPADLAKAWKQVDTGAVAGTKISPKIGNGPDSEDSSMSDDDEEEGVAVATVPTTAVNKRKQQPGFIDDPARRLYVMDHEEHKPFKCPVIGCDKTYKNQNGLKYHKLHGHQNQKLHENPDGTFSIIDPESNEPYPDGLGLEKDKPYRCEVCGKRYKNLNGLKYHRGHSTH